MALASLTHSPAEALEQIQNPGNMEVRDVQRLFKDKIAGIVGRLV